MPPQEVLRKAWFKKRSRGEIRIKGVAGASNRIFSIVFSIVAEFIEALEGDKQKFPYQFLNFYGMWEKEQEVI